MRQDLKGFTLIELLIVVVILGILATIAMSQFSDARQRALSKVVQNELRALAIQQEIYHHFHGTYAPDPGPPDFVKTPDVNVSVNDASRSGWAATANHAGWTSGLCGIYVGDEYKDLGDSGNPQQIEGGVYCSQ